MAEGSHRPAWVEVDLGAVRRNVRLLRAIAAPAPVCAVVKADAYGHGAVEVARAALEAGAAEIAVAIVDEGMELREAGIGAPILILSEPSAEAMEEAVRSHLTPTLYSPGATARLAAAVRAVGDGAPFRVEVKLDTGMHRVGVDSDALVALVDDLAGRPELALTGLWTHLAVADEPRNAFTPEQLGRFADGRAMLAEAGLGLGARAHAANSAGAIAWPESRLDLVRCGISIYGYVPAAALRPILAAESERAGGSLAELVGRSAAPERLPTSLEPALSWKAQVSFVRHLGAGERLSYGLRAPLRSNSLVATVPLGYCDGIPRSYFEAGGEVLVNGRRCRLAGAVTMDQIVVECGEDRPVRPGDEVVLIGAQGSEHISADDWASALHTISYEVVTRIGPRVKRVYLDAAPPMVGGHR
jgi:alanine racemase